MCCEANQPLLTKLPKHKLPVLRPVPLKQRKVTLERKFLN